MSIKYKDLFHGPFTNEKREEFYRTFFNSSLKNDLDANFILIEDDMEDFDFFELIQEETETAKNSKQNFLHIVYENMLDNLSLLESLRFDIEWIELYKLDKKTSEDKKNLEKQNRIESYENHQITKLSSDNLKFFLECFSNEPKEYQENMAQKMFSMIKNKQTKTFFIQEDGLVIAKISVIQKNEFVEIQNFEVKESHQNQGLGKLLHDYILEDKDTVLLCFKDSIAASIYESWGYKKVSTHLSAIKSI